MSLISRLANHLSGLVGPDRSSDADDERTAAAAILVHVARVDGRIGPAEESRLVSLLSERFGLGSSAAEQLVEEAQSLDWETDVTTLIERVGRDASAEERRRLLRMAYMVAASDGVVQEFEDDQVWRMGHLLGFTDREIGAIRDEAVPAS